MCIFILFIIKSTRFPRLAALVQCLNSSIISLPPNSRSTPLALAGRYTSRHMVHVNTALRLIAILVHEQCISQGYLIKMSKHNSSTSANTT